MDYLRALSAMEYPRLLSLCDHSEKVVGYCFNDSLWEEKLVKDYGSGSITGVSPHNAYLYLYSGSDPLIGKILSRLDKGDSLLFGKYYSEGYLNRKALETLDNILDGKYVIAKGNGMEVGFSLHSIATLVRGKLITKKLDSFEDLLIALGYMRKFPNISIRVKDKPELD